MRKGNAQMRRARRMSVSHIRLSQRSPMALTKWLCEERTASRYTPLASMHRPECCSIVSSRPKTRGPPESRWCSSSFSRRRLAARTDQRARLSTWWYSAKLGSACRPSTTPISSCRFLRQVRVSNSDATGDSIGTMASGRLDMMNLWLCFGSFCQPAFPSLFRHQVVQSPENIRPQWREILVRGLRRRRACCVEWLVSGMVEQGTGPSTVGECPYQRE